jgi:hypothetical protein
MKSRDIIRRAMRPPDGGRSISEAVTSNSNIRTGLDE